MTEVYAELSKSDLIDLFIGEEKYGIEQDDEDVSVMPDGGHAFICTSWAIYVRRVLGSRAEIRGFFWEDNQTSEIAKEFGGHDFAIVDGRFIVDAWLVDIGIFDASKGSSAVFDMQDAKDGEVISRLYGDVTKWVACEDIMKSVDNESAEFREKALSGTAFEMKKGMTLK